MNDRNDRKARKPRKRKSVRPHESPEYQDMSRAVLDGDVPLHRLRRRVELALRQRALATLSVQIANELDAELTAKPEAEAETVRRSVMENWEERVCAEVTRLRALGQAPDQAELADLERRVREAMAGQEVMDFGPSASPTEDAA